MKILKFTKNFLCYIVLGLNFTSGALAAGDDDIKEKRVEVVRPIPIRSNYVERRHPMLQSRLEGKKKFYRIDTYSYCEESLGHMYNITEKFKQIISEAKQHGAQCPFEVFRKEMLKKLEEIDDEIKILSDEIIRYQTMIECNRMDDSKKYNIEIECINRYRSIIEIARQIKNFFGFVAEYCRNIEKNIDISGNDSFKKMISDFNGTVMRWQRIKYIVRLKSLYLGMVMLSNECLDTFADN